MDAKQLRWTPNAAPPGATPGPMVRINAPQAKGLEFPQYGGSGDLWWRGSSLVLPGAVDWKVDTRTSSAVMACVNWATRRFPEAPIRVVQVGNDGERDVIRKHHLPMLLKRPNPFYGRYELWAATIAERMLTGNAYWQKIRNKQGVVIQLWWHPESTIEPAWPDDGSTFISHYVQTINGRQYRIPSEDIVHFRDGMDPNNPRKGLSPLASVIKEIYTDEEAASFTATILKNMGVPGLIISPSGDSMMGGISEADAEVIKDKVKRKTTGANRGEPIVMSGGVKVDVLSFSPKEMNVRELRRIPEERVTAVLDIPAVVVGLGAGLDHMTYSNMEEAREAAYEGFIVTTQNQVIDTLEVQLLPDFGATDDREIEFDNSNVRVLQEDENAKAARWGNLVNGGLATVAEGRNAIGLPVEPYHEVFLRPANIIEIPAGQAPPPPTVVVENVPPAALPAPEKSLEPEYKSYGSAVRAIEGRAARATTAYLKEQYEKAAAAGRGWQGAMDMGDGARSLWNKFYPLIVARSWDDAAAELGTTLAFDLENQWVKEVIGELAEKIVRVSDTTRDEVRALVSKQAEEGWSIDELAAKIRELKEVNSVSRARRIARTETGVAYNLGSLAGYREAGIEKVEVFDGDEHEPCASANGAIWTIEEARANPLGHPNCVRAFAAVVED
jgi:HK97 family phage portal protein